MSTSRAGRPALRRRLTAALVAVCAGVSLSACDFEVTSLPLPGGPDVGDEPMQVTVEFRDVLDLVPQSAVKIDEVSIGKVTSVELDTETQTAVVTVEVPADTKLPANAVAEIRQTSLLGEKFVELDAPEEGAETALLEDGDTIPLDRTGRNPEVEEVLGALSLVLNGGGVAQLQTISQEVNAALEGREDAAKSVLNQIDELTGQLDDNKGDIVNAIEALDRLARSAREQQGTINAALEELPSALNSIDRQREDLVRMLEALNDLSDVGVRVIRLSKDSTIEALTQLQPVLTKLADSGDAFVDSFNVALTFPFIDEVVGRDPQVARNINFGDYTNLSVTLDLDLGDLNLPGLPCTVLEEIPDDLPLEDILDLQNLCEGASDAITQCVNDPTPANCARLPEGVLDAVCESLPVNLPVLCGGPGGRGNGGGGLLPNLGDGLGNLGTNLGNNLGNLLGGGRRGSSSGGSGADGGLGGLLNRPAPGASAPRATSGPTMGQLMQAYDPGLVSMLVPPLADGGRS